MGTLTVRVSDEVEEALRRRAAQLYGATRGALSRAIEDAIRTWLSLGRERTREERVFRAYRGGRLLAEARTLEELAERLKREGESVRGLRVVSVPAPPADRRLGLRTRGRAVE